MNVCDYIKNLAIFDKKKLHIDVNYTFNPDDNTETKPPMTNKKEQNKIKFTRDDCDCDCNYDCNCNCDCDCNYDYDYDIRIFNNTDVKLYSDFYLGHGSYGKVYYIGKNNNIDCVVKISNSEYNNNQYKYETHFYTKYKKMCDNNALPEVLHYGTSMNKINGKKYDYIVIECVGLLTLSSILKICYKFDDEDKKIIQIIYKTLFIQLKSIHKTNIAFRDITVKNIVLSNNLSSYFADKYQIFKKKINTRLYDIIHIDTKYDDICKFYEDKNYNKICSFVDVGLACDLDHVKEMKGYYNKKNPFVCGLFDDYRGFETLFSSTIINVSPFFNINISDMISKYNSKNHEINELINDNIITSLKVSDIWSFTIIFLTYFHDITFDKSLSTKICSKLQKHPRKININVSENLLHYIPYDFTPHFALKEDLLFEINDDVFFYTIKKTLDCVIEFCNNMNTSGILHGKLLYILNYDEAKIKSFNEGIKKIYTDINTHIILYTDTTIL